MKRKWTDLPVWDFIRLAGGLLALNVLCFLCCLPVVTIVASFSAMYGTLFKLKDDTGIPVIRTFLLELKENILPSLAVEGIAVVLLAVAGGDAYYALSQEGAARFMFLTVATVIAVIAVILLTFGTTQIARFKNTVKNYIKNSFVLALVSPGWMVLAWLVWAVFLGLLLAFPRFMLTNLGWFYFMWGLSIPAYICTGIFSRVFKRFE